MANEGAVPTANVCAACPGIQADLALVKGRQQMVMAGQEEIKQSLHEIYSLLRASNGRVSSTDAKLAELAAQVKAETLNAASVRAGFISLAFMALWEGAKRMFHL